jgi:alkylation response protein AidB-like acyl-CoA dehydrogenase
MVEKARDWRADLVIAYADLFDPAPGDPPSAQGWPFVGDGWRDLLERACARIRTAIQAHGGSFRASQVSEKYGGLRFYFDGALPSEAKVLVEEAIDLAEARAACTCETCGEAGSLYGPGWLTTRCAQHADGRRPEEEVKPLLRNIRVVTRFAGDRKVVRCRRYVRETDSFVDVDPTALDLGEE